MDQDKSAAHELASKVDALVGKRSVEPDGRNIPILTDLVDAPQRGPHQPVEGLATQADAIKPPTATTSAGDFLQQLSDQQIDQLSHDILQRVTQRIDAELATSLEARLSEQFQSQLNATVTHVLADMKQSIANEIGDAVNAALADRQRQNHRK